MIFKSINPHNGKEVGQYESLTESQLSAKLDKSTEAFAKWRNVPLEERCKLMKKAGEVLRENVDEYAKMISMEMGKPIKEGKAEVNKCALVCDYYADNAPAFLANEIIETDAQKSF